MTVEELVRELNLYPPSLEVVVRVVKPGVCGYGGSEREIKLDRREIRDGGSRLVLTEIAS